MREQLEQAAQDTFNKLIAEVSLDEALDRAENFAAFVEASIDGLKGDIERRDRNV